MTLKMPTDGRNPLQTLNIHDALGKADWVFQQRWKKLSAESDDPEGSNSLPHRSKVVAR
jgi:hypothetical protein